MRTHKRTYLEKRYNPRPYGVHQAPAHDDTFADAITMRAGRRSLGGRNKVAESGMSPEDVRTAGRRSLRYKALVGATVLAAGGLTGANLAVRSAEQRTKAGPDHPTQAVNPAVAELHRQAQRQEAEPVVASGLSDEQQRSLAIAASAYEHLDSPK